MMTQIISSQQGLVAFLAAEEEGLELMWEGYGAMEGMALQEMIS